MAKLMITESELNRLIKRELIREGFKYNDHKFLGKDKHGFIGSFINNAIANSSINGSSGLNWEPDKTLIDLMKNGKDKDDDTKKSKNKSSLSKSSSSDSASGASGYAAGKLSKNNTNTSGKASISFSLTSLLKEVRDGNLKFGDSSLYSEVNKELRENRIGTSSDFDRMLADKTRNNMNVSGNSLLYTYTNKDSLKSKSYTIGVKQAIDSLCDSNKLVKTKELYSKYFTEVRYIRSTSDIKKLFKNENSYSI